MLDPSVRTAPRLYARIASALYLYVIAAGTFAEVFVRSRLVVPDDAATTARNILADERLFRLAFSAELLHLAFDIVIAVILYALLRPVNREIALLAALARMACDVILAVSSLSHFAALRILEGQDLLRSFDRGQREELALLAMRLHGDGYAISLLFFSFACFALGHVIFRAGYLPRFLGVLLGIAGVCYAMITLSHFLALPLASTPLFIPIFIAEATLALWLLLKGVDIVQWEARLAASVD